MHLRLAFSRRCNPVRFTNGAGHRVQPLRRQVVVIRPTALRPAIRRHPFRLSPPPDQATLKKLLLAEQQRMLVRAHLLLARTEHDAGATQRELDALQQVVKLQPDNTVAHSEWIVALWQAGQRELARQQLQRLNEQATPDVRQVGRRWPDVDEDG